MLPLLEAQVAFYRYLFTLIKQDLYLIAAHLPLAIQARAAGYFTALGLGPVRHWPY